MADFEIPDKTQLTSVDRGADSLLIYDNDAQALKRSTVNNLTDLTSHPVGIDDVQTLTNKTITAPTISSPVLSGTITGTYTIGGTPTFPSSVVTLTGSQTLTNKTLTSPAINTATITNPTLTVDTISEFTSANGVTIDGLNIKDGAVGTNGVVTASITNSAVTTAKIADANITNAKLATGAGEPGGAWTAWTPTYTNLTVGNGTVNHAVYKQVGKIVFWTWKLTIGSTTSIVDPCLISFPVTPSSKFTQSITSVVGHGSFNDGGGSFYPLTCLYRTSGASGIGLVVHNSASTYAVYFGIASASIPVAMASGDIIELSGFYEAA